MFERYPHDLATLGRSDLEQCIQERAQTIDPDDGRALARVLTRCKTLLHTNDRGFAGNVMMDGLDLVSGFSSIDMAKIGAAGSKHCGPPAHGTA